MRRFRWSRLPLRSKGLLVAVLPTLPTIVLWLLIGIALVRTSSESMNAATRSREIQNALLRLRTSAADDRATVLDGQGPDTPPAIAADLEVLDRRITHPDGRAKLSAFSEALTTERVALGDLRTVRPAPAELTTRERAAYQQFVTAGRALRQSMDDWLAAETKRTRPQALLLFGLFVGGSIAAVGGGLWLAVYLMRDIAKRAERLVTAADGLLHGQDARVPDLGADEIGALGRRLSDILELIQQRDAEVAQRNTELTAVNKELEAFSYSVSHDLRAPLRSISGFSQIIDEDAGPQLGADSRDALRRVRAAAERMSQLIDHLLMLSRLTRTPMRREAVDLSAICTTIVGALAEQEPQRHVDVHIAPGLQAVGDKGLLTVALDNLLRNAWKYTRHADAPRIVVTGTEDAAGITITVEDNGAGFDMAHASLLFGAFQRLHTQGEFEGTGIGLATVQRVAHRHGGRVAGEGRPGEGARFTFFLPHAGDAI